MLVTGLIAFFVLICFTIVKSGDDKDCTKAVEDDYAGFIEYLKERN